MAKWYKSTVRLILELQKSNPHLGKLILASIKRLEKQPMLGTYVRNSRYYYTDMENGFRIAYNYHSLAKEIEVVVIRVFDKRIS